MTKRNLSLYFAENISQPFDPKEFINKKDQQALTFESQGNIYYCTKYYTHPIDWADFFEEITNSELSSQSFRKYYAIVFFLTSSNNMFAITFGTGNNKLNKSKFVYNFGLKTALNMLNLEGNIYHHSSKSISEIKTRKDIVSSSALQISQLDFNQLTDVLNAINGDLSQEYQRIFGCKKIQGGQALNISLDSVHLMEQLNTIENAFRSLNYQSKFKFIDNISPLLRNETELKENLNSRMVAAILNNDFSLFAPLDTIQYYAIDSIKNGEEDISDFSIQNFKRIVSSYLSPGSNLVHNNKAFIHFLKNKDITIKLQGFDGNIFSIYRKLYDFISVDVATEEGKFLLEQGKWFRFAPNLTETLDDFFNNRLISAPPEFPALPLVNNKLQREEDYLRELSGQHSSYILGDQKLVDQTEVFDLFNNNTLYHIKKGTIGSAPLSHLFSQGLVSIERLKGEKNFFSATCTRFPNMSIDPNNLYLRFGIIRNNQNIPIFSKITFKSNAEAIEKRIANQVKLFFIPHEEEN